MWAKSHQGDRVRYLIAFESHPTMQKVFCFERGGGIQVPILKVKFWILHEGNPFGIYCMHSCIVNLMIWPSSLDG